MSHFWQICDGNIFPSNFVQFFTTQKWNFHIWIKIEQKNMPLLFKTFQLPNSMAWHIVKWVTTKNWNACNTHLQIQSIYYISWVGRHTTMPSYRRRRWTVQLTMLIVNRSWIAHNAELSNHSQLSWTVEPGVKSSVTSREGQAVVGQCCLRCSGIKAHCGTIVTPLTLTRLCSVCGI